ncbi:MAG: MBL fold metallo-hydrolase [Actinomycetales bacterium]|nr:MBL fold metallo-hydrolase [Actinomycetales bacterium]
MIFEIDDDLWALPQPVLGDSRVEFTNCYILRGADGEIHVIDPGWSTEPNWRRLQQGLAEIGASTDDIAEVLATHLHADHLGLARQARDHVRAPFVLGTVEAETLAVDIPTRWSAETLTRQLERWGAPREDRERIVRALASELPPEFPQPDRTLDDGELLPITGRSIRAVLTPGHTPGHLCFWDQDRDCLFTGDHVLPHIHPGLGLAGDGAAVNGLVDYIDSLDRVEGIAGSALPGHGDPIDDLGARVREIRNHQFRRSAEIAVLRAPGDTAWSVATRLRWRENWSRMGAFRQHSAVSQVAMHLRRLDAMS